VKKCHISTNYYNTVFPIVRYLCICTELPQLPQPRQPRQRTNESPIRSSCLVAFLIWVADVMAFLHFLFKVFHIVI